MFDGMGVESVTEQLVTLPVVLHPTSAQLNMNVTNIDNCGKKGCARIQDDDFMIAHTTAKHNPWCSSKARDESLAQVGDHKNPHRHTVH